MKKVKQIICKWIGHKNPKTYDADHARKCVRCGKMFWALDNYEDK